VLYVGVSVPVYITYISGWFPLLLMEFWFKSLPLCGKL